MSGTLMSISAIAPLQQHPPEVAEDLAEVGVEARRRGAVDRRGGPSSGDSGSIRRGWNALPSQTGSVRAAQTPRIATSGALMIGVK